MVSSRKRPLHELDNDAPEEPSLLHRIRNMWQFANLCQWIYLFGKAVKIGEELDVEEIEAQCLNPNPLVLQEIGLALLKFVSSHRGLTHELFDEYTRRQYVAMAPEKSPFGTEESPARFADFDIFTKIRVLQQLTQWVMIHPDRVREKMEEQKDVDQTSWRIEPIGWDSQDRSYFVLDDDRLYRLTEAPPTPLSVTPKKKPKGSRKGSRASKRRRMSVANSPDDSSKHEGSTHNQAPNAEGQEDGLGGMKWECLAVTLDEVRQFILTIHKTRDANERVLRDQLEGHLVPILERQEEGRKRKALQREKELLNLAKMANAKRSSRLAGKAEQQKMEEKAREEEQHQRAEEAAVRRDEYERLKLEKERDLRLLSREKRLKEREARRLQHEDELQHLSEDSKTIGGGSGRMSERRLQAEIEKNKQALKELEEEDEEGDWIFDCVCGVYGQIDDGTHSVACEKCSIWQHSKCVGIRADEAERLDFHFVCGSCRRLEEDAKQRPRPTIKLKVNRPDSDSSTAHQDQKFAPLPNSVLVVEASTRLTPPEVTTDRGAGNVAGSEDERTVFKENHSKSPTHHQEVQLTGQVDEGPSTSNQISAVNDGPSHRLSPTGSQHGALSQLTNHSGSLSSNSHAMSSREESNGHNTHNDTVSISQQRLILTVPITPNASNAHPPNKPSKTMPLVSSNGLLSNSNYRPQSKSEPHGVSSTQYHYQEPISTGGFRSHTPGSANRLATPVMAQDNGIPGGSAQSSTLPSAEGGFSPTKHSPPLPRSQPTATTVASSTLPLVFPPAATLSPSPRQQILTPPTKSTEPTRRLQAPETPSGSL